MPPDADKFLPTRRSLLTKLKSWDNHDSWREFFETYWRLIFGVARKAGLNETEAQDVVQETIVSVAKQMPGFKYDRVQGSFKSWLRHITRCRIADVLRKRYRSAVVGKAELAEHFDHAALEQLADPNGLALEAIWDQEWEQHLRAAALAKVKKRVKLEHFQIFELHVLQNWPVRDVAATFGVAVPTVYWISQRTTKLLKQLAREIEAQEP